MCFGVRHATQFTQQCAIFTQAVLAIDMLNIFGASCAMETFCAPGIHVITPDCETLFIAFES